MTYLRLPCGRFARAEPAALLADFELVVLRSTLEAIVATRFDVF